MLTLQFLYSSEVETLKLKTHDSNVDVHKLVSYPCLDSVLASPSKENYKYVKTLYLKFILLLNSSNKLSKIQYLHLRKVISGFYGVMNTYGLYLNF